MRYMNWDVLMFPEAGDTNIPLQEFSTACTVIQDPDNVVDPMVSHQAYFKAVTYPLPTVSCFTPSLLPGSSFKISLHSWAVPIASRATQAMAAQGNTVWFEAKVLLDGVCSAVALFDPEPSWPQVIETGSSSGHAKKREPLRFPAFHPELLTQIWANPGQNIGTIKIVIAEGICQGEDKAGFSKLRNLVTFSFQHAPLHVLENCGIAWPNPGMWWQAQQQFHSVAPTSAETANNEAHAHSPRRSATSKDSTSALKNPAAASLPLPQGLTAHPVLRTEDNRHSDPFWSQHGPMHDPFTGNANPTSFYKAMTTRNSTSSGDILMADQSRYTSSSHDQSMLDCSRPLSPVSHRRSHTLSEWSQPSTLSNSRSTSDFEPSGMNHLGLSHLGNTLNLQQEDPPENHFDEMMASYSPRHHSLSGISAPSNTRVSSAANTPPSLFNRALAIGDLTKASSTNGHTRSVAVTTIDPPPLAIHPSKSAAVNSPGGVKSEQRKDNDNASVQRGTVRRKPVGRPKGRKEGKTGEIEEPKSTASKIQRSATTGSVDAEGKENVSKDSERVSDGKRKRGGNVDGKVALLAGIGGQDAISPIRKFSKRETRAPPLDLDELDELTSEGVKARIPLQQVENRL